MDLLRAKATKTRLSELLYLVFNAALPIIVFFLVRGFDPPYLALAIILLSKWRVFALRPRFWWANIKANMVDVLVGVGVVGLLYLASGDTVLQIALSVLYGVWLLVIKPRSNLKGITLQAGIAQFVGLVVLFHFSAVWPDFLIILGSWLIGYASARHVISSYEEPFVELWSTIWGLLVAELGWILFNWTTVYNLGLPIQIPQIALIMLVLGFSAIRLYHAQKHDRLSTQVKRGTMLFAAGLLVVILLFSTWDATL